MMNNEKYLFERIRKGDEAAFKVIYRKYVPRLYYFVFEYVPYHDIVENIIQETLMVLWEKRLALSDDTNLGAYLFTVAKNNCLYKLRDKRYRQQLFTSTEVNELDLDSNMDALSVVDTSQIVLAEIEQIIENTLEQLPQQCQVIFRLSRLEGKKNREIAEELGISEKTVEGHITKALKIFRVALKNYFPIVAFLFAR